MTQALVSIVIPLFNSESFVDELMASLTAQTLDAIEIICVDDGSTDTTMALLEKAAATDPRIRVITQEHAGAGPARNTGLEQASASYIMFLDADDSFQSSFVKEMYTAVTTHDVDIAVCRFSTEDSLTGRVLRRQGFDSVLVEPDKAVEPSRIPRLFAAISAVPHNKIWRKSLILDNDLRFSATRSYYDVFFSFASLVKARRIVAIDKELYTYRVFRSSASINSNLKTYAPDFLIADRQLYTWLVEEGLFEQYKDTYLNMWGRNMHRSAKFARNPEFASAVADALANEEPWASMTDEQLQREADLQTVTAQRDLRSAQKSLRDNPDLHSEHFRLVIQQAQREIENVWQVIRQLQIRGRQVRPEMNPLRVLTWKLSQRGFAGALRTLRTRMNSRANTEWKSLQQ